MPCYHPLDAWNLGEYEGKKKIVFKDPGEGVQKIGIPCGHCIGCKKEHARQWALRAYHESLMHEDNCFLTLTYRPEELPKGETLVHEHLTNFIKLLRDKLNYKPIKYFACGEYGDNGDRPHYHILLFGHDFKDKRGWKTNREGQVVYFISDELNKIWKKGFTLIAPVNYETAQYVAGYVIKKRNKKFLDQKQRIVTAVDYETGELCTHLLKYYERFNPLTNEVWEVEKEFIRMSRGNAKTGPNGIGLSWYKKYKTDFLNDGTVHANGAKQGSTKYYDKLLETDFPERFKELKTSREKYAIENQEEYTQERLAQKELVQKRRNDKLTRNLEGKLT